MRRRKSWWSVKEPEVEEEEETPEVKKEAEEEEVEKVEKVEAEFNIADLGY